MAKDVGKEFGKESLMNLDIANGAYYEPIIITYLYAIYQGQLVHEVLNSEERKEITMF